MVYKVFDKKAGSGISLNEKLAEKLHKPVIKKIKNSMRNLKTKFRQQI